MQRSNSRKTTARFAAHKRPWKTILSLVAVTAISLVLSVASILMGLISLAYLVKD